MKRGLEEVDELNAQVLTEVLPAFERLSPEARQRLLQTIAKGLACQRTLALPQH
jgi:hypothetical protein